MAKIDGVQEVAITDLKPYVKNAKKHSENQVELISKSIKEFGFLNPILIDQDKNIIAGHGRLMAAQKLGMDKVPCIYVEGLSEEQYKAYVLADNKLTELGEWDMDLVTEELEFLKEMDFDVSLTGFELTIDTETDTEAIEDNFEAEIPEEPKAKMGDIYQLGNHRLMCGDSTSIDDIERLLDGNNIELVLTDAPYGVDVVKDGKVGADFGVAKKGDYFAIKGDDTTDTAKEFYNSCVALEINKFILFGGNYFIDFLPFSDSWIIWDKRGESGIKNTFADGELAWCSFHTPVRIYHQLWNGMIREGEHEKRVHPTQKPVRMLAEILQDFSKENENILDGFGGSGSTLMACEQTNRRCFMIEYEPHYVDVIINRWEQFTGNKAILLNEKA